MRVSSPELDGTLQGVGWDNIYDDKVETQFGGKSRVEPAPQRCAHHPISRQHRGTG